MTPTPDDPETSTTFRSPESGEGPKQPPRFISRLRATANIVLLVSGFPFLIGFLLVIAGASNFAVDTLHTITSMVSILGFIAFIAFITSVVSILIENRTAPPHEQEDGP